MKRFVLGATFLLAACTATHAGFTQAQLGAVYADAKPNAQLPLGQGFVDETGKKTTLRAAIGNRPAVVVFADYTCTTLCGPILPERQRRESAAQRACRCSRRRRRPPAGC